MTRRQIRLRQADFLDKGMVGHYGSGRLKTAMPADEQGDLAVAGHRNTHGEPFRYGNRFEPGDPVVVETRDAYYVHETASALPQTSPSNVSVGSGASSLIPTLRTVCRYRGRAADSPSFRRSQERWMSIGAAVGAHRDRTAARPCPYAVPAEPASRLGSGVDEAVQQRIVHLLARTRRHSA
ncbi:Integral membrane protein [Streptomyces venezuelae]|nr:Integral membrane protein [Streptomyces venezuelae]CUM37178.1 sortase family protein [Streptomyces venezuelae]